MKTKPIEQIITPPLAHMVGDGFQVHTFFPANPPFDKKRMSPFFLLDYNSKVYLPPSKKPRGVGVHPHRGFETVTIAYHGKIAHHDSAGNSGVIEEGEVQWMTAASGVLHKEYHEKEFSKKGGDFQMIQLWVNLPAKHKMSKPKYQAITRDKIGRYKIPNQQGHVEIIAGEYNGVKGPASTFTPIHLYNVYLKKGNSVSVNFPSTYNTGMIVVEGKIKVNEKDIASVDHFILFKNEGEEIFIHAEEETIVCILSGEPINEPIASYGPFLMNTMQEINQAIDDFDNGRFGVLPD